jgi:hypothetical protein
MTYAFLAGKLVALADEIAVFAAEVQLWQMR